MISGEEERKVISGEEDKVAFEDKTSDQSTSTNGKKKIIFLAVAAIVIILAVVLGVVFGTRSNGDDANKSQLSDSMPTPSSDLANFLSSVALRKGAEFVDPFSYQSKALAYMEDIGSHGFTEESLVQRYALACFFFATSAVATAYTDNDVESGAPAPWTDASLWMTTADECQWFGIVCDEEGRVANIDLNENGLTGSIPNEIVYLKETLTYLDISLNIIFNEYLDLEWMGQLTNIRTLLVGSCYFLYNGVPPFLENLNKMEQMDISYTLFHGPIRPEVFTAMTELTYLEMGGNGYNSTIPSEIATLPSLDSLYIENAFISGDLSFLASMDMIFELWIDDNSITGSIPTSIGERTTLRSISLAGNLLTGTIPTGIGLLTDMTRLWLYDNSLTGTVPTQIGLIKTLEIIQVEQNELNGEMPQEICTLRAAGPLLEYVTSDCETTAVEVECSCCDNC